MPSVPSTTPGCVCNALITSASPNNTGVLRTSLAVTFFAPISDVSTAGASRRDTTTTSSSIVGLIGGCTGIHCDVRTWLGFVFAGDFFTVFRLSMILFPLILYSMSVPANISDSTCFKGLSFAFTDTFMSRSSSEEYTKFFPVCSTSDRNTLAAGRLFALTDTFCAPTPNAIAEKNTNKNRYRFIP